jgi:uncharacterized protein (TIGR02118 family)
MVKVLFIMHMREDLEYQEFLSYWRNKHGALTMRLPGLAHYVQRRPYPDPHGDPLPADGVDEMHFESLEAMQEALGSPEGKAMRDDFANFLDSEKSGPIVMEEDREFI